MSSLDWSSASSSVDAHAAAPPLLALLQAAPLVFNNGESLQPIDLLDLKKERDAVLAALLLNLSGGSLFDHLVGMLVLSHAPVFVVDALISALALNLLWRMLPDMTRELCL